ncbi:P-loop containing nucleoside triphosphate hydrolase protein [Vararia minispora EC-137]|uniref:P-loop containing nucleoside triphosphate hydrolase protein n=1 Tax=Vararia minispora EC-137 TaxID=1314806 RepID=A0ACB8QRA9_9AGAM|nr:P-loop containing nucleoside triphosphate hydrolase protein [Vararia minispora EC-137]
MAAYPRMDPYKRTRYNDNGIDAKIVVMGNTGVGKTSLLQRYTQNKFDPKNTTSTTGAFFVTKKVFVNGTKVRLQLWDTAGQERFRSMAPMYYRGANAALLLYDITSLASFNDVKGWLEELKKNCGPDLIIYIVGSKRDLHCYRQVSPDLARLSLHNWFPPPRPPTPPPPPTQPSTFSYIRPRFTSFTSIRSVPLPTSANKPSPPESNSSSDQNSPGGASALKRANTAARPSPPPAARSTGALLSRSKTVNTTAPFSRFGNPVVRGWNDAAIDDDSQSLIVDEDEDEDDADGSEWGLSKGMELFEVSAKDNTGVLALFDALIGAIIKKRDAIEADNELKRRDSVFLGPLEPPTWAATADAEAAAATATEKARPTQWSSCCTT